MNLKDAINYFIAVIAEFAKAHGLSNQQAFRYLDEFKGLDFIERFYDVEHTLSFDEVVADVTNYCRRMGGSIS